MRTFKLLPTIGGLAAPPTPLLSRASPPGPPVLNFSEYERCRTCYLEVYTIFGVEMRGRVYIFSDLKTLEVHTICGSDYLGSVYYFRN